MVVVVVVVVEAVSFLGKSLKLDNREASPSHASSVFQVQHQQNNSHTATTPHLHDRVALDTTATRECAVQFLFQAPHEEVKAVNHLVIWRAKETTIENSSVRTRGFGEGHCIWWLQRDIRRHRDKGHHRARYTHTHLRLFASWPHHLNEAVNGATDKHIPDTQSKTHEMTAWKSAIT